MIEYKVLADDPQKGLVVQGNFAPGSIPVNIPHSNPKRKQYISLFLNLRDIEAGIDYLQCISPNNHLRINEGLFISALRKPPALPVEAPRKSFSFKHQAKRVTSRSLDKRISHK